MLVLFGFLHIPTNVQMKFILLLQILMESLSVRRTSTGELQASIKEPNKLVHKEFYIWFLPILLASYWIFFNMQLQGNLCSAVRSTWGRSF